MKRKKKKTVITPVNVVYAVVAVVVLWGIVILWRQHAVPPVGVVEELQNGEIPSAMPSGIVVVNDAQITHSYTEISKAGEDQSSLIYTAKESTAVLMNDYVKYLGSNGWTVQGSHVTPDTSYLDLWAAKASSTLSIVVSNDGTSTRMVVLNFSD